MSVLVPPSQQEHITISMWNEIIIESIMESRGCTQSVAIEYLKKKTTKKN